MARQKRQALGNDPLFNPEGTRQKTTSRKTGGSSLAVSEETVEQIGKTYKELKRAQRALRGEEKKEEQGEFTRMTFIVRRDLLDKLRSYANEEGITAKEALDRALYEFFDQEEEKAGEKTERDFLDRFSKADEKTRRAIEILLGDTPQEKTEQGTKGKKTPKKKT